MMNSSLAQYPQTPHHQQGVVLAISLIILLLMTIIGVSAMNTTSLQEKMTSNMKDYNVALQSAEAAIVEAEAYLDGIATLGDFNNTNGLYENAGEDPLWGNIDWTSSAAYNAMDSTPSWAKDTPKYVIEHFSTITSDEDTLNLTNIGEGTGGGDYELFRITAYGESSGEGTGVLVQTIYSTRL